MESMLQFGGEYLSYSLDLHLSEVEHVMRLPSGHNIKKQELGMNKVARILMVKYFIKS